MEKISLRRLNISDLHPQMLIDFHKIQSITSKWVKKDGAWELEKASALRQWDEAKKVWMAQYLRQQLDRNGCVLGAFENNRLIGFAAVDGGIKGQSGKYANLTLLFIDDNWKRRGIGTKLFRQACLCAAGMGADKLFISAVPSYETVAFYFKMGCLDAEEVIDEFVDTEFDRYLEYSLNQGYEEP